MFNVFCFEKTIPFKVTPKALSTVGALLRIPTFHFSGGPIMDGGKSHTLELMQQ